MAGDDALQDREGTGRPKMLLAPQQTGGKNKENKESLMATNNFQDKSAKLCSKTKCDVVN